MTHLYTTRNPMSESRRQHVHGKLVTLADQARAEGEPSILLGALIVALPVLATAGLIIAL